jgi:hypothetical protein
MKNIIIVFLFLLAVMFVVGFENRRYQRFLADAQKISGKITMKEELVERFSQPTRKVYYVHYTYQIDGMEYTGRDNVEYPDLWLEMKEGQEMEIYYTKNKVANSYPAALVERRAKNTSFFF